MRVILLNQYYPPDVAPTGVMLEAVARHLAESGHAVTVICARQAYAERTSPAGSEKFDSSQRCDEPGVRVIRLRSLRFGGKSHAGKLLAYLGYYCGVAWRLLWTKADLVVALTTPPYLSVLARAMTKLRGGRHAHWVMDIYPDVMTAHGMLKAGGWRHRFLQALARWGLGGKRCGAVVGLGPDMAAKLQPSLSPGKTPAWVPLWGTAGNLPEEQEIAALRETRGWKPGEVVLLYSGNMGLGHRFTEVLEAARKFQGEGVRLAFYGGGRRRAEVAAAAAEWTDRMPLSVSGYVDSEDLAAHLAAGDVHLASLEPAWDGTMVPSKLQGIFAAGRPVLFTGSQTSSIGRWIIESGAGWVCPPGDVESHLAAMNEALDPETRARMGAAARGYASRHFDKETNAAQTAALLTGERQGTSFPATGIPA